MQSPLGPALKGRNQARGRQSVSGCTPPGCGVGIDLEPGARSSSLRSASPAPGYTIGPLAGPSVDLNSASWSNVGMPSRPASITARSASSKGMPCWPFFQPSIRERRSRCARWPGRSESSKRRRTRGGEGIVGQACGLGHLGGELLVQAIEAGWVAGIAIDKEAEMVALGARDDEGGSRLARSRPTIETATRSTAMGCDGGVQRTFLPRIEEKV